MPSGKDKESLKNLLYIAESQLNLSGMGNDSRTTACS